MVSEIVPHRVQRAPIVKLGEKDRVVVGGENYAGVQVDDDAWTLAHENHPARKLVLSHSEIEKGLQTRKISIHHDYHCADAQKLRMIFGTDNLEDLECEEDKAEARYRQHLIETFEYQCLRGNKINKTEAELHPELVNWTTDYNKKMKRTKEGRMGYIAPSARHFSNWYNEYQKHKRNPLALARRYNNGRSRKADLCPESFGFALSEIRENYMTRLRKDKATAYREYQAKLYEANQSRDEDKQLHEFSKTKFYDMIDGIDKFQVMAARETPEVALAYFAPNRERLETQRAGQLVQFDDWLGDVHTLFLESGMWDKIPEDFQEAFKKVRIWLCVAICTTTRYVLAVNWSLAPNGATAASTARMVMSDKRHIGLSVGAQTPWMGKVVPERITSDNGSAYLSDEFSAGYPALGIDYTRPPAGKPKDRAFIESLFHTFATLLVSWFDGRTFANPVERGEYPASKHATLAAEEFVKLAIFAILDIYHNRAHSALGTSPHVAWQISTANWPIRYHVSEVELLRAFGHQPKKPRKISHYGIVWMGIPYHSTALARELITHGGEEFIIRCDPMSVKNLLVKGTDGWFMVKNRIGLDETVALQEWVSARQEYKRLGLDQAKDGLAPMYEAMNKMRRIGEAARIRMNLTPQAPSAEQYEQWDEEVFGGWVVDPELEVPQIEHRFALPVDPLRSGTVAPVVPKIAPSLPAASNNDEVAVPAIVQSSLDYNDEE